MEEYINHPEYIQWRNVLQKKYPDTSMVFTRGEKLIVATSPPGEKFTVGSVTDAVRYYGIYCKGSREGIVN